MLCLFQEKCSFFFFKKTHVRYGKRSYPENCFFGNFEMKIKYYHSPNYDRFSDYNDFYHKGTSAYTRNLKPPKPNNFNFKPSTLIHLSTKATKEKKNVTEAMISGLHLGPTNLTMYFGHCQGSGIHVITSKNWSLHFKLVYVDSKPCFFKILRLIEGKLKLSIPNFAVRFSCHFDKLLNALL